MDRLLGRWLAGTMPGEMTRLAQLVERAAGDAVEPTDDRRSAARP